MLITLVSHVYFNIDYCVCVCVPYIRIQNADTHIHTAHTNAITEQFNDDNYNKEDQIKLAIVMKQNY